MIFVVLGTQKFQLNRLLAEIDKMIENDKVNDDVFAQIGHSDYIPQHFKSVCFLDKKEFDYKIKNSDIIVTHSGVGSIITALQHHKPTIVFPRLKKYNEHVDNHQLDIALAFEKGNYVFCYKEDDDLAELIDNAKTHKFVPYIPSTENIIQVIRKYIEKL